MKICHLTSVHPYTDVRIYLKECRALATAGHETHFVAPHAPDGHTEDRVHLHGIPKSQGGRLSRMTKTVWNVYRKGRAIDADVYHFHDPELIPIGLLLKMNRKKVIYDVHEDVPRQILSKTWIPRPVRRLISWAFERFENVAARRFDAVVTATPFIRDRFLKIGSHAIDVNNFPILRELHLPDADWSQKQAVVCYVGNVAVVRGINEMVEAIGQTNAGLLVAGGWKGVNREQLLTVPGWSQTQELGVLGRDEVKEVLARSMAGLVVLHPIINYVDALPIKMFEYMSAGIAVIASDFPLWREIVEANRCGICVNPRDPRQIAEAIQWIIDHPQEAKQMGERGRHLVETKFNWEMESAKLLNVYQELIAGAKSR